MRHLRFTAKKFVRRGDQKSVNIPLQRLYAGSRPSWKSRDKEMLPVHVTEALGPGRRLPRNQVDNLRPDEAVEWVLEKIHIGLHAGLLLKS